MTKAAAVSNALQKLIESMMRKSMGGMLAFARDRNMSFTQLAALVHLHYKGASSVSDIAKRLGITNAAASQLLRKLEDDDLLQRCEGADDRRVRQVKLGNKGRELVEALIESRFRWLDDFSRLIDDDKADQILCSIQALTETMRQAE